MNAVEETTVAKIVRNHYVLAVPDANSTAEWFIDVLGFGDVARPKGWRFIERDSCMMMIGSCPDAIPPKDLGDHNYFAYLVVNDADDYYGELKRKSAGVSQIDDKPWGMREFSVRTPDGHRIMIGQRISPATT